MEIEATVAELLARQEIRDLLTRYCRAVDRLDRELLLSCYHPDALDDHGFFVGGPEAFWDWVQNYHGRAQSSTQHIITNHSCDLAGDVAHCETYWMMAGMDAADHSLSIGGGRYLDRVERRDGHWRIAVRKCVSEWGGAPSPSKVPPEFLSMLRENGVIERNRTDVSYERPLTVDPARIGTNLDILAPDRAKR